jgi:UDP-N-acetylglucosamine 2-epimerase (non-hydrolysing)
MLDAARGVVCVVGTRPEVVKTAPVVHRLRRARGLRVRLIATAQHRELLDQALAEFDLAADDDLDLMEPGQTPARVLARGLAALEDRFAADPPALVIAQGDTTSVLCAGFAAFYSRIEFAHLEAGLRTGRLDRPFPEEMQRVVVSRLARIHFAPTAAARANLLSEGVAPGSIHVTGNTVIDAVHAALESSALDRTDSESGPRLLVTVHRRENFGAPLERICEAIGDLLDRRPALRVLWPIHPNPAVEPVVRARLGDRAGVEIVPPLPYRGFLAAMARASVILTDSGGIQEEAPALGKPVVVLREETERGECLEADAVLVGSDSEAIRRAVLERLDRPGREAAWRRSPVGDGLASERVARVVLPLFGLDPGPVAPEFAEEFEG